MYTQCPECQTIFELGIDELKAAEGQVCCGECDKVFNALASLTELPDEVVIHRRRAEDQLEEDADRAGAQAHAVTGELFENLPPPDSDAEDSEAAGTDEHADDSRAAWDPDGLVEPDKEISELEQNLWEQKLAELGLAEQDAAGSEENEPQAGSPDEEIDTQAPDAETNREGDDDSEPDLAAEADWLVTSEPERKNWPWAAASLLAGLALIAQGIHYWHEDLARMPAFEAWLKPLYRNLGDPIPEDWDVYAYRVAKDTVSNHPEAAGALLVNASVANDAPRPQPYPLLKITLLDRWGEPIGERFFAPAEYLGEQVAAGELIGPGESAEASVLIVDPGAGAVSYGIDACLRESDQHLLCAHDGEY